MNHFLAYGNSDQESFRQADVLDAFDVVTVPGTIAAFYEEATAGFVLTIRKPYIIDPRTPLLQGSVGRTKASHLSLAEWLGPTFSAHVAASPEGSLRVSPEFLAGGVVREMTAELTTRQREYGEHAPAIERKLDRYRRLLAIAQGKSASAPDHVYETRPPKHILAPYFAVESASDPWWRIANGVWEACQDLPYRKEVSPVVTVRDPRFLASAMSQAPKNLANTSVFWLTGFDERRSSPQVLQLVLDACSGNSGSTKWVNLYGGFFSICLGWWGLDGFNNGLGYSESRDWPELGSTGAAPPRYYMRSLHVFQTPAAAQLLIDADRWFACDCRICTDHDGQIVDLGYHELKQHFALSRRWELDLVAESSPSEVASHLRDSDEHMRSSAGNLPSAVLPDIRHLTSWAQVIQQAE